jgi:hypothetical protein
MKRVTLNRVHPGVSKLDAIKCLRTATGAADGVVGAMGLKEAKEHLDRMTDLMILASVEVEVEDTNVLHEAFDFYVHPGTGQIDKEVVLDFVLDVLSYSDPHVAQHLLQLKSYRALRDALR